MTLFDPRGRLQAFTQKDWAAAERVVQSGSFTLGHASIAEDLPAERLLAFMLCLEADALCQLYNRIYHTCEEHPIRTTPFRAGLPREPFRCPECESIAGAGDDLRFDIECRLAVADGIQLRVR